MPAIVTSAMAERCHRKITDENTTNDRHAIALYNAARFYVALGDKEHDATLKSVAYDAAVSDLLESRDRAADTNTAFINPWQRGDKRSQAAQMASNRFFLANRSYLLGKAYLELGKLNGARACAGREQCFEKAAAELEHDAAARAAGTLRDDYFYLRASVYLAWGQFTLARRDLELLKDSPTYGAPAVQALGEMFIADAKRQLVPPLSLGGIAGARASYQAALSLSAESIQGQLGLAETYMLEARIAGEQSDRRTRYGDAAREFGRAISMAGSHDQAPDRLRALEGRGTALLELARLGVVPALDGAISDLKAAAELDPGIGGAPAMLMLARSLIDAKRESEADIAYAEAERRFGADPRASLARGEHAFARGKQLYARADHAGARAQFQQALAEMVWQDGRADAYFFLSAIDLLTAQNAIADADAAKTAGGGISPYWEQACLARIAAGGVVIRSKAAMANCAGNDLLLGLFYLRHAQLMPTVGAANESRRLAQDAFIRARTAGGSILTSPMPETLLIADLAAFGSGVALSCSSAAGLNVSVDLDVAKLEKAKSFFQLHRVHACVASD
ncbi:hypothetical protein DF3PB_10080 [uncultured Defluviicoccus sp.]|uniref:Uncharacterized protein n=1 Tax=metagenome TaxID=256318 RepID=A0A380T9K0_9ZZZZ|nr:hypothetical protein DF3PB_10080 [uncultured Defluviicoccus sp.]